MTPAIIIKYPMVLMMICFTYNNIGYAVDELQECKDQIDYAFPMHMKSIVACIRHAIQYYVSTEYIPISKTDKKRFKKGLVQADEDNYAMKYYRSLFNNIYGGLKKKVFCQHDYKEREAECLHKLKIFGEYNTAKNSLQIAYTNLKISQFQGADYEIERKYMEQLIIRCTTIGKTKRYEQFCFEELIKLNAESTSNS